MAARKLDRSEVYAALDQRIAWLMHWFKAAHRAKRRARVAVLAACIPPRGVILDIGAHMGYFAKEFTRLHAGSCTVHCFEPIDYSYRILARVLARRPNAVLVKAALGDTDGSDDMVVPVKGRGRLGPGLAHLGREEIYDYIVERVETLRLDTYARRVRLPRCDFVKCDVEGSEHRVLQGAAATLERCRPVLLVELDRRQAARLGASPEQVFALLGELSYRALRLDARAGRFIPVDGYRQRGDYLFLPERSGRPAPAPEFAGQRDTA